MRGISKKRLFINYFLFCLIGSLGFINVACDENDSSGKTDFNAITSEKSVPNNYTLDTTSGTMSCAQEKELIERVMKTMKNRVTNARKAYSAIRGDEIRWGKYIRNWNIEAKNFRSAYNAMQFSCIKSFYIGEAWVSLLEIGNSYAFDNLSRVNEFERKLNSDISSTLKELKKVKVK